jgi:hypothetical protein
MYEGVFKAEPRLLRLPQQEHLFRAATFAAQAAAGEGTDADTLSDAQRSGLRRQALSWLREDLAGWSRLWEAKSPEAKQLPEVLARWQQEPALAGIRDDGPVGRLPADEQEACRALWRDVRALEERITSKP